MAGARFFLREVHKSHRWNEHDMKTTGHTVLVTGGASGIGFGLAERFLAEGNAVILCGRREDKLREARDKHGAFHTRVCDLSDPAQREALAAWACKEFPQLDVIVNNAGIQQRVDLTTSPAWPLLHAELATNLEAHIHLATLFIPQLMRVKEPAIVNVTSGLGFIPLAAVPVYSATKAAMRSFTLSLRHQLRNIPIEVVEIIPPAVNTDLGGPGLHTFGAPLDEFADAVFAQLKAGKIEAVYGFSEEASRASAETREAIFSRMNAG
jgi:uncharacterized oxidoreductase